MSSKKNFGETENSSRDESVVKRRKIRKHSKKFGRHRSKRSSKKFFDEENPNKPSKECNATFDDSYQLTKHSITHSVLRIRMVCTWRGCDKNDYFFASKQLYY